MLWIASGNFAAANLRLGAIVGPAEIVVFRQGRELLRRRIAHNVREVSNIARLCGSKASNLRALGSELAGNLSRTARGTDHGNFSMAPVVNQIFHRRRNERRRAETVNFIDGVNQARSVLSEGESERSYRFEVLFKIAAERLIKNAEGSGTFRTQTLGK
jgi:hypothetical protein